MSKGFRHVADAPAGVGVAELIDLLGLNHNAIRQHLAQLVAAGLVVESAVPTGGRGRPRLSYEIHPGADSRWGVPGPYERLSAWLAEVVRTGDDPAGAMVDQMVVYGFEPTATVDGERLDVTLAVCPYGGIVVDELVRTDPRRAGCRLRCHLEPGPAS